MLFGKGPQIRLNSRDGLARRFDFCSQRVSRELLDRCPDVKQDTRLDVRIDRGEFVLARFDDVSVDRAADVGQVHGFVQQRRLSNVVAANHQRVPADESQLLEQR